MHGETLDGPFAQVADADVRAGPPAAAVGSFFGIVRG
jgi:hypothetical protein